MVYNLETKEGLNATYPDKDELIKFTNFPFAFILMILAFLADLCSRIGDAFRKSTNTRSDVENAEPTQAHVLGEQASTGSPSVNNPTEIENQASVSLDPRNLTAAFTSAHLQTSEEDSRLQESPTTAHGSGTNCC